MLITSYKQTAKPRNSDVEGTAQGNYLRGWGLSVMKRGIQYIYGIQIWGSSLPPLLESNRQPSKKYSTHTEPLFKLIEILPLPSLTVFFKIQFMQLHVRGHLPASFNNLWITNKAQCAGYSNGSVSRFQEKEKVRK